MNLRHSPLSRLMNYDDSSDLPEDPAALEELVRCAAQNIDMASAKKVLVEADANISAKYLLRLSLNPQVRGEFLEILTTIGPKRPIVKGLLDMLRTPDGRSLAKDAYIALGPASNELTDPLTRLLGYDDLQFVLTQIFSCYGDRNLDNGELDVAGQMRAASPLIARFEESYGERAYDIVKEYTPTKELATKLAQTLGNPRRREKATKILYSWGPSDITVPALLIASFDSNSHDHAMVILKSYNTPLEQYIPERVPQDAKSRIRAREI